MKIRKIDYNIFQVVAAKHQTVLESIITERVEPRANMYNLYRQGEIETKRFHEAH